MTARAWAWMLLTARYSASCAMICRSRVGMQRHRVAAVGSSQSGCKACSYALFAGESISWRLQAREPGI